MPRSTRLSSKGQVVIPAWARRRLGLETGEELRVDLGPPGERSLVLRAATPRDVERDLEAGYAWLERSGQDPVAALHAERKKARERERRRR